MGREIKIIHTGIIMFDARFLADGNQDYVTISTVRNGNMIDEKFKITVTGLVELNKEIETVLDAFQDLRKE